MITKFKVGDKVWSKHLGVGVIISINDDPDVPYPIRVRWINKNPESSTSTDVFTTDGRYLVNGGYPDCDIYLYELGGYRVGDKKLTKGEKEMKESTGFKLGDRVYAPYHGYGTVTAILSNTVYPIEVTWDIGWGSGAYTSTFTSDGHLSRFIDKDDTTISVVKEGKEVEDNMEEKLEVGDWVWLNPNEKGIITFIYPDKDRCLVDSELDGEVEAVMAGLTKVEYSPINPSHYQVAGIPEAIDIMKHLMTQEQFKGFLWGNIIKYAYRYGRKGDEHDTAGKIEWYANRLKEVCAEEKKEQERE